MIYVPSRDTTRDWIIWGVSIGVTAAAAYVLYNDLWLARRRNEDDSEDGNEATLSECNCSLQSIEAKTDAGICLSFLPLHA